MKSFQKYLIYSLVIHLLLLFLIRIHRSTGGNAVQEEPIWIDLQKDKKYKLADILEPEKQMHPDHPDYLGLYDSKVEEERVAALRGRSDKLRPGDQQREKASKGIKREKLPEENELSFHKKEGETIRTAGDGTPVEALPEDFFPDLRKGSHTYLNVARFPGVHYFVMLKRVFKTTWNPRKSVMGAQLTNQLVAGKIETVLGFSIKPDGELAELFIFKESGVEDYDREALRTVRASAPFASVPKELKQHLDDDGLLRLNYIFTVYL